MAIVKLGLVVFFDFARSARTRETYLPGGS